MTRKEELLSYLIRDGTDKELIENLVNEVVFLENEMDERKKLPFINVNPRNPSQQKSTPAFKQYKELLQQYTNIIKILMRVTGTDESDEESPLRKWVKSKSSSVMDDIRNGKGLKPLY